MHKKLNFLVMTMVLILTIFVFALPVGLGNGQVSVSVTGKQTIQTTAITWSSSPQIISDNLNGADSSPELVVDSNGVVHVLWLEETGGSLKNLTYASSADGFSTNTRIRTLVQIHSSGIGVDSLGVVHVFWAEDISGKWEICYANSSTNYQKIEPISNNIAEPDFYPHVAIDTNNIVHVVWSGGTPAGGNEIFYTNSTNFRNNVSVSHNPGTVSQYAADILITPSNSIVHVLWRATIGGGTISRVFYATSADGFATNKTVDQNPYNNNYNPKMVLDSSGAIHCVWSVDDGMQYDLYSASSSDGFSTNKTVIAGANDDVRPEIAIDSADNIHVLWRVDNGIQKDLYYASSNDEYLAQTKIIENPYDENFQAIGIHQTSDMAHIVFTSSNGTVENLYYASFSVGVPSGGIPGFQLIPIFITLIILGLMIILVECRKRPLI